MKPPAPFPSSHALLTDGMPAVRMVMIYEDADGGRRAKQFADEVLHGTGGDCEGTTNFWSFDVLGHKPVRNAAASAAARADLVIFAASGERKLSPEVTEWLELWVWLTSGKSPALVALLDDASGKSVRKIRSDLRAIAERKALEFVAFHFHAGPKTSGTSTTSLHSPPPEGSPTKGNEGAAL